MHRYRLSTLASALLLATPLAVTGATGSSSAAAPGSEESPDVVLTWARIAHRTVVLEGGQAPVVAPLYLAFTSRAVQRAADDALDRPGTSVAAAVATAAHDVLVEYFPASTASLDTDLASTLAAVPDGPAEARGARIGARHADEVIAERADDGRNDPSYVYAKAPGIGVWQPPATGMFAPWLGYVDPLVVKDMVPLDGPDPVGSPEYRTDRAEVMADGSALSGDAAKQATARFFVSGSTPVLYRNAVIAELTARPLGLADSARLFAQIDAAMADAAIQGWRHKFEVGFWRPIEAIRQDDGDPLTPEDPTWTPLLPTPPYSEWVSGHGILTSAYVGVLRCHYGDDLSLTIGSGANVRTFSSLSDLEHQAVNARIWAGLHFRDAMDDAYLLGHTVAARVTRHHC